VLLAMGRDATGARGGLRLSVGPATTAGEIDRVLDLLPSVVRQVRAGAAA
jgi:cysteine desulfurase